MSHEISTKPKLSYGKLLHSIMIIDPSKDRNKIPSGSQEVISPTTFTLLSVLCIDGEWDVDGDMFAPHVVI